MSYTMLHGTSDSLLAALSSALQV